MKIRLLPIGADAASPHPNPEKLPWVRNTCAVAEELYRLSGFNPPWLIYLAESGEGELIGTCGFKTVPADGEVEIVFYTFRDWEGLGVATAMVEALDQIAADAAPETRLIARTLPFQAGAIAVLRRLGFEREESGDALMWKWKHT
jgi:ribosomal-protein-alanine N-acetyltransferase